MGFFFFARYAAYYNNCFSFCCSDSAHYRVHQQILSLLFTPNLGIDGMDMKGKKVGGERKMKLSVGIKVLKCMTLLLFLTDRV